jgi:hypothetical protein
MHLALADRYQRKGGAISVGRGFRLLQVLIILSAVVGVVALQSTRPREAVLTKAS